MSDSADLTTLAEEKKKTSTKWIVWITWCIITAAILLLKLASMIIVSNGINIPTLSDDLVEKVISSFFAISLVYLGANVAQKGIYSWKDVNSQSDNTVDTAGNDTSGSGK